MSRHGSVLALVLAACSGPAPAALSPQPPAPVPPALAVAFADDELARVLLHSPLPPVPPDPTNAYADSPAAAALGQRVFFEPAFSRNGRVSCATCHDPSRAFTDARELGRGLASVSRNTPTLWNVAHNRWFFWDGRADSLWAQALVPLEDPREHGATRLGIVRMLARDPVLRSAYEQVFGPLPDLRDRARFPLLGAPRPDDPEHPHARAWDGMTDADQQTVNRVFANVGKALAAYERRLISRQAPFDTFVGGLRSGDAANLAALDPAAQRGLQLFVGRGGCHVCHAGPHFSDKEFHDIGVPPRSHLPPDTGRLAGLAALRRHPFHGMGDFSDDPGAGETKIAFLPTSRERLAEHQGQFKTPTLRNVALTAPYMHQGQFATLEDVLQYYSTLEQAVPSAHPESILVPLHLSEQESRDLIAFLQSLTDTALDPTLIGPPDDVLPR